jgi:hypothetical protein
MEPLLEIRHGRAGYFVLSFFAVVLAAAIFVFGYLGGADFVEARYGEPETISLAQKIMSGIAVLVCALLFFFFFRRFITNPAVFTIFREGFESNTNGVSTGFVAWSDVAGLEEVIVTSNTGSGTRKEAALAIHMQDMRLFTQNQPAWVRSLYTLAGRTGRFRSPNAPGYDPDAVPLLIPITNFGSQYLQVRELMQELSGFTIQKPQG